MYIGRFSQQNKDIYTFNSMPTELISCADQLMHRTSSSKATPIQNRLWLVLWFRHDQVKGEWQLNQRNLVMADSV